MDTLKTYFNRFRKLPSLSGDRSNSRSPKRRKKDGLTRNGSLNENLTQTYTNGLNTKPIQVLKDRTSDGNLYNHFGENQCSSSDGLPFRGRVNAMRNFYEKPTLSSSLSSSGGQRKRDKTPPPAKPPRRDKVLSVTIDCPPDKDLGIVLDSVPIDTPDSHPRGRLCSDGVVSTGLSPLSTYIGQVVRVAHIKDRSVASVDGQVKVNDEVLDINGWNMIKENTGSARLLLANAVRSGKVTMTLRRRKKRPAPPPPPAKDYNIEEPPRTSANDAGVQYTQVQKGSKKIGSTQFSHSLDSIPHHYSRNGSNSCHDNNNDGSNLTLNSMSSLGGSNDDVFCDSVGGNRSSMSRLHTSSHSMNSNNCDACNNNDIKPGPSVCVQDSVISKPDYVNVELPGKSRTQSTSAVEDVVEWNLVPIELHANEETSLNTAEIARQKRGIKGCTIPLDSSDLSTCRSDPELVNFHKHFYKKRSKHWRSMHDRSDNHTPTSCCSSSESSSQGNSPPKKRIVTRMHLLKDEHGLGIHIAGGKGSRKGDMGIFVAGITESGAAYRDGRLRRGDELLMINGKSLIGLTHGEAVEVLRTSPKLVQLVVATKLRKSASIASTASCSVPSLLTDGSTSQSAEKAADNGVTIPKVTAQTPHGTIFNLDELIERFDTSLANSRQQNLTDQPTLKPDHTQTLTINKGARGKGLGFTIVGGSDSIKGNLGIYVRRIFPRGLVAEEGTMKEGDEVIQLNGQTMQGLTHGEALAKFRQLKKGPVTIVFCSRSKSRASSPSMKSGRTTPIEFSSEGSPVSTPGHSPYSSCTDLTALDDPDIPPPEFSCMSASSTYDNFLEACQSDGLILPSSSESADDHSTSASDCESHMKKDSTTVEVLLEKELGIGLGISLIRKDTAGISHIYIQDIYQGSPADRDGRLRKGDLIMEVNGKSLQGLSLLDAYQSFRNLQPGLVNIVIKRGRDFLTIRIKCRDTLCSHGNHPGM